MDIYEPAGEKTQRPPLDAAERRKIQNRNAQRKFRSKKVQEQQNYFFPSTCTSAPVPTSTPPVLLPSAAAPPAAPPAPPPPPTAAAPASVAATGQYTTHTCRPSSQHDHSRERSQSLTAQQLPNARFIPTTKITTLPDMVTADPPLHTARWLSPEALGVHESTMGHRDNYALCKQYMEPLNFDYVGPELSSSSTSSLSCLCGRPSSSELSSSVLPPAPFSSEPRPHLSSNGDDFGSDEPRFPDPSIKATCSQASMAHSGSDGSNHNFRPRPQYPHQPEKEDTGFGKDSEPDSRSASRTKHTGLPKNCDRQLAVLGTKKNDSTNDPPTTAPGECWKPLLHIAVENGRDVIVQILLEQGIEIDERDSNGLTALHHAVRHRHETVLQLLLQSGADVNACDNRGWTPIHQAAASGYEAGVRLLLLYGVNLKLKAKEKQ